PRAWPLPERVVAASPAPRRGRRRRPRCLRAVRSAHGEQPAVGVSGTPRRAAPRPVEALRVDSNDREAARCRVGPDGSQRGEPGVKKGASAPFVSVVVPTYNRLPQLRRVLDALAAQTYRDLELVVVSDGSTDGTDQFLRSDARPPNVGFVPTQNP